MTHLLLSKADFKPDSILVRAPNWIGDGIMSSRAIHRLRLLFPGSRIDLLCRPQLAELFKLGFPVDCILTVPMGNGRERILASASLIRRQPGGYDLGILLTNSLSTALEFSLAGVRSRLGYACNGRSVLLSHSLPIPQGLHQVDRYDRLLSIFSRPLPPAPDALIRIPAENKAVLADKMAELGIPLNPSPVVMAPGAAFGTAKQWPKERFSKLIDRVLHRFPKRVVLCLGGPAERLLLEEIVNGRDKTRAFNLAGELPLGLSMALIAASACVVANDSGLMHAAWALDVPLLALFGPNDPGCTGPLAQSSRVIYKAVDCSPCSHRHCPIDHRCMTAISVDEVMTAIAERIEGEPQV